MHNDRLGKLLQRMDQASIPPVQEHLAQQVRQQANRQQQLRILAATATILLICLITGMYIAQRPNPAREIVRQNPVEPRPIQIDLARLESEAQLHAMVAERMWAMEKLAQRTLAAEKTSLAMTPLEIIEQQRQRAAMIIVDQADRHLLNNNQQQAAAKEYRQAIALFPATHGATVAQRRLEQMAHGKEGSI